MPRELGVDVPYPGGFDDWRAFFRDCALQDALDFVTIAYRYLVERQRTGFKELKAPDRWCVEVQRILQEENVHYRVDERGGVHFRFDAEFDHNRAATIASLQGVRYRAALTEFEDGMAALAKAPPDGKTAIRNTFAAAEGLFRLMIEKSPRLTEKEARKIEPLLQRAPGNRPRRVKSCHQTSQCVSKSGSMQPIIIGMSLGNRNRCNRRSC